MPSSFGKTLNSLLVMENALEKIRLYLLKQIEVTIQTIEKEQKNDMLNGSLLALNDVLYVVEQNIKSLRKNEAEEHQKV